MGLADETIFALATAHGKAGIAIIRLSGPASVAVLSALDGSVPPPRSARLSRLRDRDGSILDEALVLRFEAGASFTGEEVVELHLHGSMAVVRAVQRAIDATGLARPAEPGEFTRRALLNDRLDLTQVQGLRDVIDAETEAQRRHAMRVFSGEMAERVMHWRRAILRAAALLEATIDFADEDVPIDVTPEVRALVADVAGDLEREAAGSLAASRLRSGFEVALVGAPNVGKSSLVNALSRMDAAIVSDVAGTTRDVIEVRLDLAGVPVTILDMAGLRDATDEVETLGILRARDRASKADVRVFLREGDEPRDTSVEMLPDDIVVRTKVDVYGGFGTSTRTGAGIAELLAQLTDRTQRQVAEAGLISTDRDVALFREVASTLREADDMLVVVTPELTADLLRQAADRLQRVIGGVGVEDILDEVFSSFCIGK